MGIPVVGTKMLEVIANAKTRTDRLGCCLRVADDQGEVHAEPGGSELEGH